MDHYPRIAVDERLPADTNRVPLCHWRLGSRERRPVSAIFALCAAFSNALYVATQHIASTRGQVGKASGLRLVAYLVRSPLWLFGWAAALGAFVFQAVALRNGGGGCTGDAAK
jgi:hypothetical protein